MSATGDHDLVKNRIPECQKVISRGTARKSRGPLRGAELEECLKGGLLTMSSQTTRGRIVSSEEGSIMIDTYLISILWTLSSAFGLPDSMWLDGLVLWNFLLRRCKSQLGEQGSPPTQSGQAKSLAMEPKYQTTLSAQRAIAHMRRCHVISPQQGSSLRRKLMALNTIMLRIWWVTYLKAMWKKLSTRPLTRCALTWKP